MEEINIVYVDDRHDEILSQYLNEIYSKENCKINNKEIEFQTDMGYESLLHNDIIIHANIVIIDSRLFENTTASNQKFTGEEFKVLLKKFFPFIEVIVITQNEPNPSIGIISKYDSRYGSEGIKYYSDTYTEYIDAAVDSVLQYRELAKKFNSNDSWEKLLKEKVISSLEGTSNYDELTKDDITELIDTFKKIQVMLDE